MYRLILFLACVLPTLSRRLPPAQLRPAYSDMFARVLMFPLAAAAYSNWPQECLHNRYTNATLKRQLNVTCGPFGSNDICSGFTAINHGDKSIIISFRGTNTFVQLVAEAELSVFYDKASHEEPGNLARIRMSNMGARYYICFYHYLKYQVMWPAGGFVSKFFYDGFIDLWRAGMGDDFNELRKMYPDYDIWVTGHSLGAAMASLASSYIIAVNKVPPKQVKLVTYGQPRVGDYIYAMTHDRQMGYSFRVVHWRDLVPHVPPLYFMDYYHHKSEVRMIQFPKTGRLSSLRKWGNEKIVGLCHQECWVFYPLDMAIGANYTLTRNFCYLANESPKCSDGLLFTTSIQDHLHYFNVDVSGYGIAGCNTTMDPTGAE
ncbi:unnamed protein product [Haemonchus placei]|uniref:Lipase_3 domain-containing protein n=1 Tax=Haemonchus placei TaxID=6290 RepID=A0A0N4X5F8_HAEPC|nr:unnamed protein product [Haemonchus placei]